MPKLTGFKSGKFGGHTWGGINYRIELFPCNDQMVARVQLVFQVSSGSVEALVRWGEKHLYHFAANLFKKRCTKFYKNHPNFIEDIKNNLVSFFLDMHTVYVYKPKKTIN